jgi:hypothetical protein
VYVWQAVGTEWLRSILEGVESARDDQVSGVYVLGKRMCFFHYSWLRLELLALNLVADRYVEQRRLLQVSRPLPLFESPSAAVGGSLVKASLICFRLNRT